MIPDYKQSCNKVILDFKNSIHYDHFTNQNKCIYCGNDTDRYLQTPNRSPITYKYIECYFCHYKIMSNMVTWTKVITYSIIYKDYKITHDSIHDRIMLSSNNQTVYLNDGSTIDLQLILNKINLLKYLNDKRLQTKLQ